MTGETTTETPVEESAPEIRVVYHQEHGRQGETVADPASETTGSPLQDELTTGRAGKRERGTEVVGDEHHDDEIVDETNVKMSEVFDDASKEGKENDKPTTDDYALPTKPIKRARTGYFIFADEKRSQIQAQHPGETVGVVARALGQMWAALSEEQRNVYQQKSAQERERVAQELSKYKVDGVDIDVPNPVDPNALIFPVARIRKICKLDPEVHGISKEAAIIITKCAELATIKLGQECVKVAQLQNRRKLLPDDVAQVCSTREQFLFLREDVKDLVRDQKKVVEKPKALPPAVAAAAANTKPMTAFFAAK